jgi:hypothetical protein
VTFISVIVPTYNRVSLLTRTLDSVLAQKSADCEIIVVDDGSTDDTEKTVRRFSCVRYERQSRQGPGAARNLGWSLAVGEYIAFLDSDDVWFPWTLEAFRTCIEKYRFPKFLMGSHFPFHEDAELIAVERAPLTARAYRDYLASADDLICVGGSGMVLRQDCQPRFEAKHMNAEDLDLSLHLGVEEGFVVIRQPFAIAVRYHSCKAVADFDSTYRGILHLIDEEKGNRFPGGPTRQRERLELITRSTRPPALEALRRNRPFSGFEIYRQTFVWNAALGRWKFILGFPLVAIASLPKLLLYRQKKWLTL